MTSQDVVTILSAVLGAGGFAALVKTFFERRDVLTKARKEHIGDLAKWRDEMHEMVIELQGHLEFYRSMAADFEYQLRSHGIEPRTTAVRPTRRKKEDE